jgi:hypothetical protein
VTFQSADDPAAERSKPSSPASDAGERADSADPAAATSSSGPEPAATVRGAYPGVHRLIPVEQRLSARHGELPERRAPGAAEPPRPPPRPRRPRPRPKSDPYEETRIRFVPETSSRTLTEFEDLAGRQAPEPEVPQPEVPQPEAPQPAGAQPWPDLPDPPVRETPIDFSTHVQRQRHEARLNTEQEGRAWNG